MNKALLFAGCTALMLGACTPPDTTTDEQTQQSSSSQSSVDTGTDTEIPETKNVFYEGTVKPAGISIYMEGTHRLELKDGRFILLEGDGVDLNGYVNESVTVHGAIRPTVEGGGIIMRVERVELKEIPASSSSSSQSSDEAMQDSSSSAVSSTAPATSSASSAASVAPVPVASSSASSTQSVDSGSSEGLDAKIEIMASDDMDASLWTRQYCTSHIGFCISVHKNWWFKSFGTTTTTLWHVELSSEEIENIGDGPIQVLLLAGSSSQDGQVVSQGSQSIGYKNWTENRHFEIRGDARLAVAIQYLIDHLTALETEE